MKLHFYSVIAFLFIINISHAQSFTSVATPGVFHSGNCTAVTDMNNDGLDDIVILDLSLHLNIAYQQPDGSFDLHFFGAVSTVNQWGMCVADMDNDGHKDVLCGGHYDEVQLININAPDDFTIVNYPWADIYTQGSSFGDINNDGWLDAFVCHDDGHSAIFQNNGAGIFYNGEALIDLVFAPEVNGNDNAGNYGSVFTDFDRDGDLDLFIAKCRQFINNPYDPRRTNVLLVNDGNNNYVNQAQERGLVNLQQSWTADFADIDNDGDFDCFITTHSGTLELYENDGSGYFTEITESAGLAYSGFYLQAKLADFDNDGYVDIIHAGGSHRYFRNNGDQTFTEVSNVFPANDVLHSFAIGDLNHDGWLDLYASYGNGYNTPDMEHADKLFLNNGGSNNYIAYDLQGTISNQGAVGALVEITGDWGTQIREVRAGESYGITNTSLCHFGIGTATEVEMVKIFWPSGIVNTIYNPAINQTHTIVEASCLLPVSSITALGNTQLCEGGSVSLVVVNAEGEYQWSNGATTDTIVVSTPGLYNLAVSDESGCAGSSNTIVVSMAKPLVAQISVQGELEFCQGESVTLMANNGIAYMWNNGATSQQVEVTQSGVYSVEVEGPCESATSESIEVIVHAVPDEPSGNSVNFTPPASVLLNANGSNVRWYDAEDATTPLFEGNEFNTPILNETTTYWMEDMLHYGGIEAEGGKVENTATGGVFQSNPSFYLLFDAHEDVYIRNVKVYSNYNGTRTIDVVNSEGVTVVSGSFEVGEGEQWIPLNFFVPQGEGYGLRCTNSNPRLWRDKNLSVDHPYEFPYHVGDLVTITNTNIGGEDSDNYYYFFYDWKVETPSWDCVSNRVEIQAIADSQNSVDSQIEDAQGFRMFPNPADQQVTIRLNQLQPSMGVLRIMDAMGRILYQQTVDAATQSDVQLNVSDYAAGVYVLEWKSGVIALKKQLILH